MPDTNETFAVPLTKIEPVAELVPPALMQLAWEAGTPDTPARVTVILQAKAEDGEWSTLHQPLRATMEDTRAPDGTYPEPRVVYHAFGLMLDAIIPTDDPRAIALGVAGKTVREMGEMLVKLKLQEQTEQEQTDGN